MHVTTKLNNIEGIFNLDFEFDHESEYQAYIDIAYDCSSIIKQ